MQLDQSKDVSMNSKSQYTDSQYGRSETDRSNTYQSQSELSRKERPPNATQAQQKYSDHQNN